MRVAVPLLLIASGLAGCALSDDGTGWRALAQPSDCRDCPSTGLHESPRDAFDVQYRFEIRPNERVLATYESDLDAGERIRMTWITPLVPKVEFYSANGTRAVACESPPGSPTPDATSSTPDLRMASSCSIETTLDEDLGALGTNVRIIWSVDNAGSGSGAFTFSARRLAPQS